jgi:hypothetical protein
VDDRLIVSQMTNTRCELVNVLIYPLAVAVGVSILVPGANVVSICESREH